MQPSFRLDMEIGVVTRITTISVLTTGLHLELIWVKAHKVACPECVIAVSGQV